jgi:hypothetical protein
MRVPLAYALILVLVLPVLGSYLGLRQQQRIVRRAVKHAMERGLSDAELVRWRFTAAEAAALDWKEEGREFRHEGQMYDIVRAAWTDGHLEFWCWWDHEESELEQRLERLVRVAMGGDADPHSPAASWGDCFKRVFTPAAPEIFAPEPVLHTRAWAHPRAYPASAPALAPPVPPPNA